MNEPTVHTHVWEADSDSIVDEYDLKWTGTYDDHVQFSGLNGEGKHIELRVFFKDVEFLVFQRDEEVRRQKEYRK